MVSSLLNNSLCAHRYIFIRLSHLVFYGFSYEVIIITIIIIIIIIISIIINIVIHYLVYFSCVRKIVESDYAKPIR